MNKTLNYLIRMFMTIMNFQLDNSLSEFLIFFICKRREYYLFMVRGHSCDYAFRVIRKICWVYEFTPLENTPNLKNILSIIQIIWNTFNFNCHRYKRRILQKRGNTNEAKRRKKPLTQQQIFAFSLITPAWNFVEIVF